MGEVWVVGGHLCDVYDVRMCVCVSAVVYFRCREGHWRSEASNGGVDTSRVCVVKNRYD